MIRPSFRKTGAAFLALLAASTFAAVTSAAAQDKPQAPSVTSSKAFKLSGYTQIVYTAQDEGTSGFAVRRSRFTLAADLVKSVRFKATVDLVKAPALYDALVEFVLHEAVSIRIGQFKVPFSLEMTTSSSEIETIDRSQVVTRLSPGLDIGSSGRDIGAVVFGRAGFLEYTLGVFNGAGINRADTNNRKDLAGRLAVRPLSGLSLGGSYYDGSYAATAGAPSVVRDRIGADLAFLRGPLSLKADFISAEDGGVMRQGWYVQAAYFFLPKAIQGVLKADSYDADTSKPGDRLGLWTAGLNWFLAERTRLMVNLAVTRNEAGKTVNTALLIQFQGGF